MGSYFSQGTKRRGSPAYCKKGKRENVPPTHLGDPVNLNAYATWEDVGSEGPFSLTQTISLQLNQSATGWEGSSADSGENLELIVTKTGDPGFVDVELHLRDGLRILDQQFWSLVDHNFRPPWGTTIVMRDRGPTPAHWEYQILA